MEVFFTVLSGVLIYVLGQITNKFCIEPINKQKETIGKISDALIFYANLYTSPINKKEPNIDRNGEREEAKLLFRNLACELVSRTHQIPCYQFLSFIKVVIKKKTIINARRNLIGLSNGMWLEQNQLDNNIRRQSELEKQLNLMTE